MYLIPASSCDYLQVSITSAEIDSMTCTEPQGAIDPFLFENINVKNIIVLREALGEPGPLLSFLKQRCVVT